MNKSHQYNQGVLYQAWFLRGDIRCVKKYLSRIVHYFPFMIWLSAEDSLPLAAHTAAFMSASVYSILVWSSISYSSISSSSSSSVSRTT